MQLLLLYLRLPIFFEFKDVAVRMFTFHFAEKLYPYIVKNMMLLVIQLGRIKFYAGDYLFQL